MTVIRPIASGAGILLVSDGRRYGALQSALDEEHRVVPATTLAAAERALDEAAPDLLLLQASAFGATDGETLRALLQRLRAEDLPIILLDPLDAAAVAVALTAGVQDVIPPDTPLPLALRRIGLQLDLRYCQSLLHAQSTLDGLTGLANRARFEEFLQAAFGNAQRRREAIALVLFDIDAFAAYNVAFGHAAGDEVLLHVGRTLSSARRRPFDLFARIAGDSFACLLPYTDLAGARAVAELVLADVDALLLDHPHSPVAPTVTVSLGIAALTPGADEPASTLLEQAMAALQRARDAGGHRISD